MPERTRPQAPLLTRFWTASSAPSDAAAPSAERTQHASVRDPSVTPPPEPPTQSIGGILQELLAQGRADAGRADPTLPELAASEPITDIARIEARIRALAAYEAPALLRTTTGVVRGRLVAALSDGPFPLQITATSPIPDAPFEVELHGYNSIYRFSVTRIIRIRDRVAVPLPARLVRMQNRASRRADAPAGYSISFTHPVLPELNVRRPMRDISSNGLSFDTRVDQDMVCAGLRLRDIVVTTPLGATLHFDAEVRIVHPPREGRGATCGLRLRPSTEADALRWNQVVGSVLNPTTRLGATWSEDTWSLYTASGYFSLSGKAQAHFGALKAPFATAARKVDAAPQVGCQVVWPSERGVEASISLLKVYEHSWFGFQIAKRQGAPPDGHTGRQVLRDIHLRAFEHAQTDPDLRWTTGLIQASAQWSKLVHYDLAQRYADSGFAAVVDFHALEIDVPLRVAKLDPNVGLASEDERDVLLDALVARRPWAYRQALDLVPERFDLLTLKALWAKAGLTRERELLVVRNGTKVIAAATVESADVGLHLFKLLDVVRLYAVSVDGVHAFPALLDAAAAWYRARGRASFTCLLEEGTPACASRLSPRDLGAGALTVLSTNLLPSFLEHLYEVTAPRLSRN
ncbi:MAG: hypothetical protein Q8P18_03095 [Pseudomonadota bacterium]|nr:hypothetical protein [Pseudomonadota bacterium]